MSSYLLMFCARYMYVWPAAALAIIDYSVLSVAGCLPLLTEECNYFLWYGNHAGRGASWRFMSIQCNCSQELFFSQDGGSLGARQIEPICPKAILEDNPSRILIPLVASLKFELFKFIDPQQVASNDLCMLCNNGTTTQLAAVSKLIVVHRSVGTTYRSFIPPLHD